MRLSATVAAFLLIPLLGGCNGLPSKTFRPEKRRCVSSIGTTPSARAAVLVVAQARVAISWSRPASDLRAQGGRKASAQSHDAMCRGRRTAQGWLLVQATLCRDGPVDADVDQSNHLSTVAAEVERNFRPTQLIHAEQPYVVLRGSEVG